MITTDKQILYRDARFTQQYDQIWQSVGKCVFCDLNEKYIIFEEHGVVLTISLFAYIDGHCMIIPRRHVKSAKEFSQKEWNAVRKLSYIAKRLIKETHGVKGMQLVQKDGVEAQSTVDHLHFHCIPFDSPDLCSWNYRQLTHTPLENVALYKKKPAEIVKLSHKFDQKYTSSTALPVVSDCVIVNEKNEVLLQERQDALKFDPDVLTLPGGTVDRFDVPLETELAREVKEETGIEIDTSKLVLLSSRIGRVKVPTREPHLQLKYPRSYQFIWNSYLYQPQIPSTSALKPGDDCKALFWIPLAGDAHPQISSETQKILDLVRTRLGASPPLF